MLSCYQQLRALSGQLRRREKQQQQLRNNHVRSSSTSNQDSFDVDSVSDTSSSGDEPTTIASLRSGMLKSGVQELKGLVHDLLRREAKKANGSNSANACPECGADVDARLRMEAHLHKANEAREQGERKMKLMDEEAKRKDEDILELKNKVCFLNSRTKRCGDEIHAVKPETHRTKSQSHYFFLPSSCR